MVLFSGGGMRAAAYSYGVLEELNETQVAVAGSMQPLVKQIDSISAVSGGSFTAAYYCLNGESTFRNYERDVLKRDIQGALVQRLFRPDYMFRLGSRYYGRSDMAADYYDKTIFRSATFGELAQKEDRPLLVINATDLSTGARFGFTQISFDLIGSDLNSFPISRAVAASTAVPLILTPVTLRNYSSGAVESKMVHESSDALLTDRFKRLFSDISSYRDHGSRRYIHLVDGGVADNLGLRAIQEVTMLNGGLAGLLSNMKLDRVNKIAIIVVDAAVSYDGTWDRSEAVPGTWSVLSGVGQSLLSRGNFESTELFRQSIALWRQELSKEDGPHAPRGPVEFYQINVNFAGMPDKEQQAFFYKIPTGLSLPETTVDRLRRAARSTLQQHPEFQRLLTDLKK